MTVWTRLVAVPRNHRAARAPRRNLPFEPSLLRENAVQLPFTRFVKAAEVGLGDCPPFHMYASHLALVVVAGYEHFADLPYTARASASMIFAAVLQVMP